MEGIDDILSKSSFTGLGGAIGFVSGDRRKLASFRLFLRAIGVLTALEGELRVSLKMSHIIGLV
jgi:hypothetical protein